MYCSQQSSIIQDNPAFGQHNSRGWKTIAGWDNEGKRLAVSIIRNPQRYTWHVTLNILHALDIPSVKKAWKHIARKLKPYITALYVREANRRGHINYHLLVANDISETALRKAIKEAIPSDLRFSYTARRVTHIDRLAWYIAKAGKEHRSKRVYLQPGIRLNKHGTIGEFWITPKQKIWAKVIETERNIADARRANPHIDRAASYLSILVDKAYSQRYLARKIARNPQIYPPDILADLAQKWLEHEFLNE